MYICSTCKQRFKTNQKFDEHSCVKKSMDKPREQRLKDLLASGGCDQAYYDEQMALLKKGK